MNLVSKQVLGLILLIMTSSIGADSPYDSRPTLVLQVCTDYPQGGNIQFKAQNNKRRLIVRSTHCWNT
jgi:hypothetical protein